MVSLILGKGEVGTSLFEVLKDIYETHIFDVNPPKLENVEIIHICFPWSDKFEKYVKQYQRKYMPKYTVVHSTVPPGACRRLNVCHSPVRGQHPNLEQGIRQFVKFVSGKDADVVAEYFRRAGVKVYICRKPETTELAKVISTTFYAVLIEFTKEMEKLCDEYGVPFGEAFTLWQITYNEGWEKLGCPEYKRPILVPIQSKLGGHCLLPNLKFLDKSKFVKFVQELNNRK